MFSNSNTGWFRRRRTTSTANAVSIYDPILFGIDEDGRRVDVTLIYRNLLIGGEPGAGKSSLLNTVIARAALCADCQLWLFDGKRVELGLWRRVAQVFVGNDIAYALDRLRALQQEMDARYAQLDAALRRKIDRIDGLPVILCAIDELAYFTVTIGSKDQQEEFKTLVRDLVDDHQRSLDRVRSCAMVHRSHQSPGSDPASPSNPRPTTAGGDTCWGPFRWFMTLNTQVHCRRVGAACRKSPTPKHFPARSARRARSNLDDPRHDHFPL